ncbi:hypothetical protein HDG41_001126 [Paraburkholderia sp. JPY162]|uniref:Uncharacterized protein n=1 Tax=Paraburkholderia youngii TaxID=2782701 RepID=A0A7W8L263_9BURK|nr:hypothetical protein [Paraburkholderia youngii]
MPRLPVARFRADADWVNISQTCGSSDAGIPAPLFFTVMPASSDESPCAGSLLKSGASTVNEMPPPEGVYFTALNSRLQTTFVRRMTAAWTVTGLGGRKSDMQCMLTVLNVGLHCSYRIRDDVLK